MLLGDSTGGKYTPFTVFKIRPSKDPEKQAINDEAYHGFSQSMWRKQIASAQVESDMQVYTNSKGTIGLKNATGTDAHRIYFHVAGWWNSKLTIEFLRFHFEQRPANEPVLLLLDDFSGHWTKEIDEYAKQINVTLLKVPANATSVCQPADATWNGPLKTRLWNMWISDLREQLRARQPGVAFKLKPPDRKTLCRWIHNAWEDTASSTIIAGFR